MEHWTTWDLECLKTSASPKCADVLKGTLWLNLADMHNFFTLSLTIEGITEKVSQIMRPLK
jgi:hypothetical protein